MATGILVYMDCRHCGTTGRFMIPAEKISEAGIPCFNCGAYFKIRVNPDLEKAVGDIHNFIDSAAGNLYNAGAYVNIGHYETARNNVKSAIYQLRSAISDLDKIIKPKGRR